MYTICVAALKGGVGKTTTATNIAYLLSKSNRVLFADADCQGDSSKVFGAYSASFGGMAKLMQNGISVSDDITVDDYCRTPKSGVYSASGRMSGYRKRMQNSCSKER